MKLMLKRDGDDEQDRATKNATGGWRRRFWYSDHDLAEHVSGARTPKPRKLVAVSSSPRWPRRGWRSR